MASMFTSVKVSHLQIKMALAIWLVTSSEPALSAKASIRASRTYGLYSGGRISRWNCQSGYTSKDSKTSEVFNALDWLCQTGDAYPWQMWA